MSVQNPWDVKQIIAPIKDKDPKLWQALDTLNSGLTAFNNLLTKLSSEAGYGRIDFILPLAGTTGLARWVVQIPVDSNNTPLYTQFTITRLVLSSRVASAGDKIDIMLSNDRGTTFNSILKPVGGPIVYDKGELPAGLTLISYGVSQFTRAVLFDNDFIRIDYIAGSLTDGLTVDLIGYYS